MAKLRVVAAPTFKAKVGIPVAGGDPVPVEMTFRHRTKTELDEFLNSRAGATDAQTVEAMVTGWDLEDEFNAANVLLLLENYIGAARATIQVYCDELIKAKLGN